MHSHDRLLLVLGLCWVSEAKRNRLHPRLTMFRGLSSDGVGAWRCKGVAMALRRWGFSVDCSKAHGNLTSN